MGESVEIEVKFYLRDVNVVRDRILAMGAIAQGRHFETNTCFENSSGTFRRQDVLLRLRKDEKNRLTFKTPSEDLDKGFKIYHEMEIVVDDFETCQAILENLGFYPEQIYEKWRETFVLADTRLLIDTAPFGVFLEIEGPKSDIVHLAGQLDLKWEERILLNYLSIFDIVCRKENLSFADMTFDNFKHASVHVERYLSLFTPSNCLEDR